METPKIEMFLGTVKEVLDRETYKIKVDIPGVGEDLISYPMGRGEMDEPVSGNLVMILSVDPVYHSVNFYTKIKENNFVGIRSNGKLIDLNPSSLSLGVYDSGITSKDSDSPNPSKSSIIMDNSGNININSTSNLTINVTGDASITAKNVTVKSDTTKIDSPDVTITGGKLKTKGMSNMDTNGPFNCIKFCPLTGNPHCGSEVSGT